MSSPISYLIVLGLAIQVFAIHSLPRHSTLKPVQNATTIYTLPDKHNDSPSRAAAIQVKRDNFIYGPSIAGNTSFWPAGPLGNATVQAHFAALVADGAAQRAAVQADSAAAAQAVTAAGGITKLSDYSRLYDGQWKNAIPDGLDSGILTNYTDDLLFSMERLSLNPYSARRLNPASFDLLPFDVDDITAVKITGATPASLLASGSLFYVDHKFQAKLESTGRYAAACDALFYISPETGDFLPLAIRTNVGSNLIYTPADTANDWLLAKIMFNLNDLWHSQFYHFAATHVVAEIAYEAAYRTLSDNHPVMALLTRLTPQLFSYRPAALATLENKGGYLDTYFAFTGAAAAVTTTYLYNNEGAGSFSSNYFIPNLERRGLINSSFGPKLKSFPFYEDASPIHTSIRKFISTFVDSYYKTAADFKDIELEAWIAEAIPAKIIDFPSTATRETLIDIITHIAFLGSVAHHTLNTNDVAEAMAVLPFHPVSLYQPPPTSKGVTDLIPYLPGVAASVGQIAVSSLFSRPTFVHSEKSLTQMFNGKAFLDGTTPIVVEASARFTNETLAQSEVVGSRKFDERGLCQGMPFIWKALDPERAPYYFTI